MCIDVVIYTAGRYDYRAESARPTFFNWNDTVYVTHAIITAPRRIYKFPTQASQLKQELPPSAVFRRNTNPIPMKSPSRQHRSSKVSDISRGAEPAAVPQTFAAGDKVLVAVICTTQLTISPEVPLAAGDKVLVAVICTTQLSISPEVPLGIHVT